MPLQAASASNHLCPLHICTGLWAAAVLLTFLPGVFTAEVTLVPGDPEPLYILLQSLDMTVGKV